MFTISEMNRAGVAWFDLMTMPVWFAHILFAGACFTAMGMSVSHITTRASTDPHRHDE